MSRIEYTVYLKEEYNTRKAFECSKVDITNMGVVICQLAQENKKYMIPLDSIYYIRIWDDEEDYMMPSPLEPLLHKEESGEA